jgi:non-specific serine/threonine protein kinase
MPDDRTEVSGVAIGDTVYAIGGLTGNVSAGTALGSPRVDVYDVTAGAWRRGPDLPVPVHHAPVVALGQRVIVVGGYATLGFVPVAATWELDTSEAVPAWRPFVPLPQPRGAHAAVSDGERVFVFGGVGVNGILSSAYVLDAGATQWRAIGDMPSAREHLAGAFAGGKAYAAGGRYGDLSSNTARVDAYDPATDTWTRVPDMPTARGGIAGASLDGRVIVFGGEGTQGTFDEAESFDPATDAWTSLAPMPTSRHGLAAAVAGDGVHVIAGGRQPGLFVSGVHELLHA